MNDIFHSFFFWSQQISYKWSTYSLHLSEENIFMRSNSYGWFIASLTAYLLHVLLLLHGLWLSILNRNRTENRHAKTTKKTEKTPRTIFNVRNGFFVRIQNRRILQTFSSWRYHTDSGNANRKQTKKKNYYHL